MPLRLHDDGHSVTLDLHGVTVSEAEQLIQRTARLAAARGRGRLTVIHGASTSDRRYRNRTIRHALYDLLDDGALPDVTSELRNEGSCLLGLAAAAHDPRRLTLADVRGR
jgi:hypothetical protein